MCNLCEATYLHSGVGRQGKEGSAKPHSSATWQPALAKDKPRAGTTPNSIWKWRWKGCRNLPAAACLSRAPPPWRPSCAWDRMQADRFSSRSRCVNISVSGSLANFTISSSFQLDILVCDCKHRSFWSLSLYLGLFVLFSQSKQGTECKCCGKLHVCTGSFSVCLSKPIL